MRRPLATVLATTLLSSGFALAATSAEAASGGALLYGLTSNNHLVSFRELAPGTALTDVAVTGLANGESLLGIDVRPSNGAVLGLGSTGRLYSLDPVTGAATATAGTPPTLSGTSFGLDVNPTVDRVRVVSDADQNLRLNPDTGAVAATDTTLAYAVGDANAGADPGVVAAAYTNSVAGASVTSLYDLDTSTDALVLQSPPNNGTLTTVGALGVDATGSAGFDIDAASGKAFAVLTVGGTTGLYTISLSTGAATLVGTAVAGLADVTAPVVVRPAYALLTDNTLATFDTSRAGTLGTPVAITGTGGADVVGIDVRPATGGLYAVTADSKLYTVDPVTGVATQVGAAPFSTALSGTAFGVDFNPTVDRLRIVSDTGQNLRVNPATGAVAAVDTALNGGASGAVGAGYTNSFPGATTTSLYDLDATTDSLYLQTPPNAGTLVPVGPLGVDITAASDLDLAADGNVAYAALTVGATPSLYRINLTTGAATAVGLFSSTLVEDLALAAPGTLAATAPAAAEGQPSVTVTVTRTAGSAGTVGVDYATGGGTAAAGSDYTATSGTLRFADGETTKTFTVPVAQDSLLEGAETFAVTFTNELGGIAPLAPVTVTIADDETGTAYALTSTDKLYSFDPANPTAGTPALKTIAGLAASERVLGLDVRPANSRLYAITSSSRILVVDPATGSTQQVSTSSTPVSGAAFGVDFNPVADRLRVVSDAGQNLRINVDTGAATVDTPLSYAVGDAGAGMTPAVSAAGYTSSAQGAATTALFDVDLARDVLVSQVPPNNGTLNTIGSLAFDATSAGLDIVSPGDSAFAVLTPSGGVPGLYRISTSTAASNLLGALPDATTTDVALVPPAAAAAGRYHALAPARVLDTRSTGGPVVAGADRTVQVTGVGGVPSTGVSAVAVNVTVTGGTLAGNLAVYPTGQQPGTRTSNLNYAKGQTIAVEVQTGLGTGGAINVSTATGSAQVVVDVLGWYGTSTDTAGQGYQALTPSRLLDTRAGGGRVAAGSDRSVQVSGLAGVPAGATAVAVNVTATGATGPLYVGLYPGGAKPVSPTSTLNVVAGQTVANSAVVTLGTGGSLGITTGTFASHVILDVVGYYGPTATGRFVALTPARLLDERATGTPVTSSQDQTLTVAGAGGVPATGVGAAALSVTGTLAGTAGYVQVYPSSALPAAPTSTLNVVPNSDVANLAVSSLGAGGAVGLKTSSSYVFVIVDVTGYFTLS